MKPANILRTQIAVAILSFASVFVFASNSPTDADEVQSFIGTTPDASDVAPQPETF